MRQYPNDSPEAAARIVALAMMADGTIDRSEVLLIERQRLLGRLGLDNEQFDAIYYEFCTDMLTSGQRKSSGELELDEPGVSRLLDEINDPTLQKKTLRIILDIVYADQRLTAGEALLIAQALKHWNIDLCGGSDASTPRHSATSITSGNRFSTASCSPGGAHHVATG